MRSGPLPWRHTEWKDPHKQGYVIGWKSQHEAGVPIFNSELQKYILIKLMIHLVPSLHPTPSPFILQLKPGLPGLLQIL